MAFSHLLCRPQSRRGKVCSSPPKQFCWSETQFIKGPTKLNLNPEQSLRRGGKGGGHAAPSGRSACYTGSLPSAGPGPNCPGDKPTLVVAQPENLLSSSCRHAPPHPIPPSPLFSPPWQPLCFQMFTLSEDLSGGQEAWWGWGGGGRWSRKRNSSGRL